MAQRLEDILTARRSVRAYSDAPVARALLTEICRAARTAPSGANLQPGQLHILTGAPLKALSKVLIQAAQNDQPPDKEYSYFPDPMPAHLKERQRRAGYALYETLGIERRDLAARRAQFLRNYGFFEAPVGVIVTIERSMGKGCFMDLGMMLMSFLLAAEDKGLATTGIGAIANYGALVHRHLDLEAQELVVCGIALGYADRQAPVNQLRTERLEVPEFTTFRGFDAPES